MQHCWQSYVLGKQPLSYPGRRTCPVVFVFLSGIALLILSLSQTLLGLQYARSVHNSNIRLVDSMSFLGSRFALLEGACPFQFARSPSVCVFDKRLLIITSRIVPIVSSLDVPRPSTAICRIPRFLGSRAVSSSISSFPNDISLDLWISSSGPLIYASSFRRSTYGPFSRINLHSGGWWGRQLSVEWESSANSSIILVLKSGDWSGLCTGIMYVGPSFRFLNRAYFVGQLTSTLTCPRTSGSCTFS
jgi:hypothetical protein